MFAIMKKNKVIVGLTEPVIVIGKDSIGSIAKFDTGAARSSIDEGLAEKACLGPVVRWVRIRSSSLGIQYQRRPVVKAELEIKGKKIKAEVNLAKRSHSSLKVLIGRDIIHGNFIIDIDETHESHKECDLREKW
ncbi:MAG TPA: hypothetical protein ENN30_00305 [Candidatus Woesearchaeota archaeon]|nr:hypothetical protein [Candidatus Woesearchaeota archaeon]